MYILKMNSKKFMYTTTHVPIRQFDSNVDAVNFLVPHSYEDKDLSTFVIVVKYTLPNGKGRCEVLNRCEDYKGYMHFQLPIDTDFTALYGNVRVRLILLKVMSDDSGNNISYKLHTNNVCVPIEPIDTGNVDIDDENTQLDDMTAQILAMQKQIDEINQNQKQKADDIEIIDGKIWLMSEGVKIGDPISGASHEWKEY